MPEDLRSHIGTREIVRALKTADKFHAVPYALELAAAAKRLFREMRSSMKEQDKDKLNKLIQAAKTKLLLHEQSVMYDQSFVAQHMKHNADLKLAKLQAENDTLKAILASSKVSVAPSESTTFTPSKRSTCSIPTLKMVVTDFLVKYEKKGKSAMLTKHRSVLGMLLEVTGEKEITKLRQSDINDFFELVSVLPPRWKDACKKLNLTLLQLAKIEHEETLGPKSFEDTYIASIRSFLKTAKKDWQDQGFPTGLTTDGVEYLGDREEGEAKQRSFEIDELKRLFEGVEFMSFAKDEAKAHNYWLPLIGLYTGARVNEICQLNPQVDILKDKIHEIWYFSVNGKSESDPRIRKSVKTGDSRKIPIHDKLIELGFLNYFHRMKKSGAKLLFPAWEPINSRASGNAEKWFRKFLKDIGLRDDTPHAMLLGMHAFRHTILTHGAKQKPPLSLFCITGHAQEEAPIFATGAGKGYLTLSLLSPLNERARLLNELAYDLNIPITG